MMPQYMAAFARQASQRVMLWLRSGHSGTAYAPFFSRSRYAFRTFATFGAITIWQYG